MKINSLLAIAALVTVSFNSTVAYANPVPCPNAPQNYQGQDYGGGGYPNPHRGPRYGGGGYSNPHRGPRHRGGGRFLQQLNLTEAQKLEMDEIRHKYAPEFSQLHRQLFDVRQELHEMMAANYSNDVLRAKHDEILLLRQEMDNLRFQSMLEVREILTPEQRNELGDIMQQQ